MRVRASRIDLLIEQDGMLYPIEVKKHSAPTLRDISSFGVIDRLPEVKRGNGGVDMYV